MRTLRFIIDKQLIKKDVSCDFSGIAAGSKGYLRAQFLFSGEWAGCKIAASFWTIGNEEYPTLVNNCECMIPCEALTWNYFDVSVTGIRGDNYKITTNRIRIEQEEA